MEVRKFEIAGGNSTALVYSFEGDSNEKKRLTKELLKEVEQVGFISIRNKEPSMKMMGEELCINATLAFASTLLKEGTLFTSGLKKPVKYRNLKDKTEISIPLKFDVIGNIVLLEGIGFIIFDTKERKEISKKELIDLATKYHLPAFGGIIFNDKKITPYVYVSESDSFVKETACGSGSIAFSIFSGKKEVIQPTEKSIFVDVQDKVTKVSARVNIFG